MGILTTLLAAAWSLGSRKRQQWAGKLLLRVAGPEVRELKAAALATSGAASSSKPQSRVFVQTVSALKNLGMDKDSARWSAGQATMRLPDGKFEDTFRLAVQIATERDAA